MEDAVKTVTENAVGKIILKFRCVCPVWIAEINCETWPFSLEDCYRGGEVSRKKFWTPAKSSVL